jgi:hypothetical protein
MPFVADEAQPANAIIVASRVAMRMLMVSFMRLF